jgi:hypothetical protein
MNKPELGGPTKVEIVWEPKDIEEMNLGLSSRSDSHLFDLMFDIAMAANTLGLQGHLLEAIKLKPRFGPKYVVELWGKPDAPAYLVGQQ